jgi:ABC-type phosphate/phosphonate transport system substrate-binding protein
MIAALPMYDRPENAAAHDALWAAIRDALHASGHPAPVTLNRDIGLLEGWTAPDLVLGQACNLPMRTTLRDRVTYVATFDYGLPDVAPGYYQSLFVTRAGDATDLPTYATRRFAYNGDDSHSGWASAQLTAQAQGFRFTNTHATGAHRFSAHAVATGHADIAAIDAISWHAITCWQPDDARALQIIGTTAATPGQALITRKGADPAPLRAALHTALATLAPHHRAALGITGITQIPLSAHLEIATPPGP